jgi:hypothetical protein
MATAGASRIAVNHLGPEHLEAFHQALRRIVSTDLTRYTFAQIIDGLPTRDVFYKYGYYNDQVNNHVEPTPKSIELAKTFQETFRPDTLHVDSDVGFVPVLPLRSSFKIPSYYVSLTISSHKPIKTLR